MSSSARRQPSAVNDAFVVSTHVTYARCIVCLTALACYYRVAQKVTPQNAQTNCLIPIN